MENTSISVVYLCWLPYGVDCFQTFLNSYQRYDAGVAHQLVIVFKGHQSHTDVLPFLDALHVHKLMFTPLYYTGNELDISTYHWAASQLTTEFVFFLNTRSQILAANWLQYFYDANRANSTMVYCATGSWQSYASSIFNQHRWAYDGTQTLNQNWSKYKLLLKAATLWWYYFAWFPNPHIRTNAFFINRKLFISLSIKKTLNKLNAYRFESGRDGFTNQLRRKGHEVAIVSKEGKVFTAREWYASNIYWTGAQGNLLISDNQTDSYLQAGRDHKLLLNRLAWGKKGKL